MDIHKIVINGFKSFGDKTEFLIDKKITGIVGPNGSGKSNITEAIRFVLGEQSFKSIRGKDLTDFLFRGGDRKASRASIEITFKKNENIQNLENIQNQVIKNALEKDELSISRVIYADGSNEYILNGSVVRLKDIQEILLFIGVGNRQSWHISQGESDKILLASREERKSIIEDALNLRIYHNRIDDAEKKLTRTSENIRQIILQRKELAPEINTLAKQVEKIERGDKYREELKEKVSLYINYKNLILEKLFTEKNNLKNENILQEDLLGVQRKLEELSINLHKKNTNNSEILTNEKDKEIKILNLLENEKNTLNRNFFDLQNRLSLTKIETERSEEELENTLLQIQDLQAVMNDYIFSETDVRNTEKIIDKGESIDTIQKAYKLMLLKGSLVSKDNVKEISYLTNIKNRLTDKILKNRESLISYESEFKNTDENLKQINLKINISKEKIESLQRQVLEYKYEISESEKELEILKFKQKEIENLIIEKKLREQKYLSYNSEFENEKDEFEKVLGKFELIKNENHIDENTFNDLKRNIERLKIRLEEIGVVDRDAVLGEHKNLLDKDTFLQNELQDLQKSIENLNNIIEELKNHLSLEFAEGLNRINESFDAYVKKLFGGGSGKVVEVKIENKKVEVEGDEKSEEKEEIKTGIEIEIELPKKKVKGLHSLSGGERALTSIGLNFSILNQNKLPFMD
jgi:chromosome segregation protein